MTILGFVLTTPMYILGCMVFFIIWVVGYISVNSASFNPSTATRPIDNFNSLQASSHAKISDAELDRIARANEAQLTDEDYAAQENFEYSYNGADSVLVDSEKKNIIQH